MWKEFWSLKPAKEEDEEKGAVVEKTFARGVLAIPRREVEVAEEVSDVLDMMSLKLVN